MNFNRVILGGFLTRDPELTYTQSGIAVAKFGLAINRKYTREGEKKEEVDFFDIEVWEKQAENCQQYLAKGSGVLIEGRLKQERWEQDGKSRSRVKIVASTVQFLPKKDGEQWQGKDEQQQEYVDNKMPF